MFKKPVCAGRIVRALSLFSAGWLFCCSAAGGIAQARDWKSTPSMLARNYAIISDTRRPGDIRMILWLAPPMLPNPQIQPVLDNYVVVGVVHAHFSPAGVVSFDTINTLQAKDGSGKPLQLLVGDQISPVLTGTVAILESVFSRSFGAFGKGVQWFVFAAGAVHACKPGGLAIPFAGEDYAYQTPIPGCDGHPAGAPSTESHAGLLRLQQIGQG